jgi:hypothetical protein
MFVVGLLFASLPLISSRYFLIDVEDSKNKGKYAEFRLEKN